MYGGIIMSLCISFCKLVLREQTKYFARCDMLQIGKQFMMFLRSFGDMENHVISVERIKEYSQIQTEASI